MMLGRDQVPEATWYLELKDYSLYKWTWFPATWEVTKQYEDYRLI